MSVRPCPKCGNTPCICRPFCPEQKQCLCSQHRESHCAGPLIYTGEDDIGNRSCCQNLKKCSDASGLRQWCSNTGKCPGEGTLDYPPAPQPFKKYYDFFIKKENFTVGKSKSGQGIM